MAWRGALVFRPAPSALAMLALMSCGGGSDVGPRTTPAAIEVISGNQQVARAGGSLPDPLRVKVTSSSGVGIGGLTVTFAAAANSGSVSSGSAVTSSDGIASTTWTPGTTAGANVDTVRASVSGVATPAVFVATVLAGDVTGLTLVSGNSQNGLAGQPLAQPLVVLAHDQFGNAVGQLAVAWTVTSGGGTVSPASSLTGNDGLASAIWTPGNGPTNTAQAALSGVGTPVSFSASVAGPSGAVTLISLAPTPLVEGQTATLTGTGFSASASGNRVKIGDLAANVTAATATTLTVTVPKFNCQPARTVSIQVTVGSDASNVVAQPLEPSSFTTVAVGQQLLLQDPAGFCLQFRASTSAEGYLIGVQSASEAVSSLTPATLTAVSAGPAVPPLVAVRANLTALASTPAAVTARAERWKNRAIAEAAIRQAERKLITPERLIRGARGGNALAYSIPPVISVGNQVDILVPNYVGGDPCGPIHVTAVVRVIGTRGIWLEDMSNPSGGYTVADFQALSDRLDSQIYDTDVSYFGAPTDLDANHHIGVLITKEVNRRDGLLGFVSGTDLLSRTGCASSNEGELFYGASPDPTGIYALGVYPVDQARADAPFLIAHEFSHIIQLSRRLYIVNGPLMASWTAEGQATLAEEVVGFAAEGRASRQNLGFAVALNKDDPTSIDWFSDRFGDLADYYGFDTRTSKVAGAPEECSWLAPKPANPGPCLGNRQVYGVPWSLLRWMTDLYGPSFPGGEAGLQKALIDTKSVGYDNLQTVVGVPIKKLLAQWAAALYVDDRIPSAAPELTIPSWNLFDIFETHLVPSARLAPVSFGFGDVTNRVSVRGGSTGYFRVSGASRPATAIRVRNSSDGSLPSIMQLFVVRLQ